MRKIILISMLLLTISQAGLAAETFEAGVEFYEAGDYAQSLRVFEALLDQGKASANLYSNIGNCYFRLGAFGSALWSYERAAGLNPRDEAIRWNLSLLRKRVQDKADDQQPLAVRIVNRAIGFLSSNELATLFALGVVGVAVLLLLYAFLPGFRVVFTKTLFGFLLYTIFVGTLLGFRYADTLDVSGIIHETEIYVRYGPSHQATKAFLLHEGAKVVIAKESKEWYFIKFGAEQRGWIPKTALLKI